MPTRLHKRNAREQSAAVFSTDNRPNLSRQTLATRSDWRNTQFDLVDVGLSPEHKKSNFFSEFMMQYLIKLLVSAAIIVAVSEISKRSTFFGGLLASLPLTSFLAMPWLYHDTRDAVKVAALSTSILWLVLPSLVFFLALPALVKTKLSFYLSFAGATVIMLVCYGVMLVVLKKLGIKI
jgi:hypothetical protein